MKKLNVMTIIRKSAKSMERTVKKHAPEICIGIGVAGMITSTVLAVRSTPKALKLLEERKTELSMPELPPVEIVKTAWKCYIPTTVTMALSIGCIVGGISINAKRNAVLATAYKISESAFTEYKNKVVEECGEEKEKNIQKKIDQDHIEQIPVPSSEVFIGDGDLYFEGVSGRYFRTTPGKLEAAINELNRTMVYENYVSLSEFYDLVDLRHTEVSDVLGWNLDDGLIELDPSDTMVAENGSPCSVIKFRVKPRYDFSKLM